jgi:hypothetical protein
MVIATGFEGAKEAQESVTLTTAGRRKSQIALQYARADRGDVDDGKRLRRDPTREITVPDTEAASAPRSLRAQRGLHGVEHDELDIPAFVRKGGDLS